MHFSVVRPTVALAHKEGSMSEMSHVPEQGPVSSRRNFLVTSGVGVTGAGGVQSQQPAHLLAGDRAVIGVLAEEADDARRDGDAAGDE